MLFIIYSYWFRIQYVFVFSRKYFFSYWYYFTVYEHKAFKRFLYLLSWSPFSAIFLEWDRELENILIISLNSPYGATQEELFSYFLEHAHSTVNKTVRLAIFDSGE